MRFVLSQTIIAVTEKGENDMPRYIDVETALKIIDNYAKTVTADGIVVVKAIRDIVEIITPTADVVPKSEVESIFDELIKQAGEIAENYKKEADGMSVSEFARIEYRGTQIGGLLVQYKIAELKKKYTEGKQ